MKMQNGTASMENSRKGPQGKKKKKNFYRILSSSPTLGISLKVLKSRSGRDVSTSVFTATLLTASNVETL